MFFFIRLNAQNISFTTPLRLPNATTDKSVSLSYFNSGFYIAWKDLGNQNKIHVSFTEKTKQEQEVWKEITLENIVSTASPCLQAVGNKLYLLWISPEGNINYIINENNTGFKTNAVNTFQFTGNTTFNAGIAATAINNQLVLVSHTGKNTIVYAVINVETNAKSIQAQIITDKKVDALPSITALNNSIVRICWKRYKDQAIDYADVDILTQKLIIQNSKTALQSSATPALAYNIQTQQTAYVFSGPKNAGSKIYYAVEQNSIPVSINIFPSFFATTLQPAICNAGGNNFLMAYTAQDNNIYTSRLTSYDPHTWMQDFLLPQKEDYTLKDIVIPGAHDAGMSVLTAAGGYQSQTINECNTLTQTKNIGLQLNAGIRMFDLRVGVYNKSLYSKHCSSDCMEDAIGGGYGEKLKDALDSIKNFLHHYQKEIVIVTFSHFCEKEIPIKNLADSIFLYLGKDIMYTGYDKPLNNTPLKELAGKIIVLFEGFKSKDKSIDSNTIQHSSNAFINFKRAYAGTNELSKLSGTQEAFFNDMKNGVKANDLIRLDWQLTQSSDEAAMVCNDFQSEKTGLVLDGAMLLTNVLRKHKSIIDLSQTGNKLLPGKVNDWINAGIINKLNKPNILYIDVADTWITDYVISLNSTALYKK
ncbi:hypothetical protein ACI6Q2_21110 [Chitinophagaceae bacterium LWZ2-11]